MMALAAMQPWYLGRVRQHGAAINIAGGIKPGRVIASDALDGKRFIDCDGRTGCHVVAYRLEAYATGRRTAPGSDQNLRS